MPDPRSEGPAAPLGAPGVDPSHYAEARTAFNAAVAALYERSTLPVSEIARAAGVAECAIYRLTSRMRCPPRRPTMRPRGAGFGPRRTASGDARLHADGIASQVSALRHAAAELDRHVLTRSASLARRAAEIEARRRDREARQRRRAAECERLANLKTLQYLALTLQELSRTEREQQERKNRADPRAAWLKRAKRDQRHHKQQSWLVSPLPSR